MTRHRYQSSCHLTASLGLSLWICSCGTLAGSPEGPKKGDGTSPTSTVTAPSIIPPLPAPLKFSLTDAAVPNAKSVFVTISALEVTSDEANWTTIPLSQTTEIDLLSLQGGTTAALAELTQMAAGTYTQTRLMLAPSSPPHLVTTDGVDHPLTIPSGAESGLKIDSPFTLVSGTPLALTIDFDVRKSLLLTGPSNGNANSGNSGKYMMKPVLRLVADATSGTVVGKSSLDSTICVYATGTTPDATNDCPNSVTSGLVRSGAFKVGFIPSGTYTARLYPTLATGLLTDVPQFTVQPGQTVDLGSLN